MEASGGHDHARFSLISSRHYLCPVVLLLLAEEPAHGYRLVDAIKELGLRGVDRSAVYRTLADLEQDGLIRSWDEPPIAGSTRHVHAATEEGVASLSAWMQLLTRERDTVEHILGRYGSAVAAGKLVKAPAD